jgi:F-box/leucine-rich repeat protein 2/20
MTCPDSAPGGTSQVHGALHGIDNGGVDGGRMSFEHAHGAVPVRFPTSSRATSYRATADEVDAQHTTSPASSASHSNMSGSSYFDGEHSRGDKGKGVARPVTIPSAEHSQVEAVFAMSPVEASSALYEAGDAHSQELYPSSSPWQAGPCELQDAPDLPSPTTPDDAHEPSTSYSGKGKRRAVESPATLGLAFTPLEVKYGRLAWPSSVSPPVVGSSTGAGPSSYSPDTPPRTPEFETPTTPGAGFAPTATEAVAIPTAGPSVSRPERVRTMSNDSTSSTRSIASKIRVTLRRRGSSYLTKKLRFGPSYDKKAVKSGNILQGLPAPDGPLPTPPIPDAGVISSPPLVFDLEIGPAFPIQQPLVPPPRPGPDVVLLKGRSYSSPYPLTSSVLDIIPPSTAELTLPITFELPCHFEDRLPHELKVRVFAALVRLHEEEHERVLESGSWTALKAASTRHRWVGTNKGVRELVKFGRVSHRIYPSGLG